MEFEVVTLPTFPEVSENFQLKVNPNYEEFLKVSNNFIIKYAGKFAKEHASEDRALLYAMTCTTSSVERLELVANALDFGWLYDDVIGDDPEEGKKIGKNLLNILEGKNVADDNLIYGALKR